MDERHLTYVMATIIAAATFLLAILFFIQIRKSRRHKRIDLFRNNVRKIINKIIIHDDLRINGANCAAFEFYLAELRLILSGSRAKKQLLIREIIDMKRFLTGSSSEALIATYKELTLYKESARKLKAMNWQEKALGIRELAEMGHSSAVPAISRFLTTSNPVLRQESLLALVRLENIPLSFLTTYNDHLSKWMEVNIYHHLCKSDPRRLPKFQKWFHHANPSVRCFSISMAYHFRQSDSIPALAELLYESDAKVVRAAAIALGELEAFEHRETILKLANHCSRYHGMLADVLKCLAKIGDPARDIEFLKSFLTHPSYTIRTEAAVALIHFERTARTA